MAIIGQFSAIQTDAEGIIKLLQSLSKDLEKGRYDRKFPNDLSGAIARAEQIRDTAKLGGENTRQIITILGAR
jgi:hypothetical protein